MHEIRHSLTQQVLDLHSLGWFPASEIEVHNLPIGTVYSQALYRVL